MPFCVGSEGDFVKKCKKICTCHKNFVTLCDFWFGVPRKRENETSRPRYFDISTGQQETQTIIKTQFYGRQ